MAPPRGPWPAADAQRSHHVDGNRARSLDHLAVAIAQREIAAQRRRVVGSAVARIGLPRVRDPTVKLHPGPVGAVQDVVIPATAPPGPDRLPLSSRQPMGTFDVAQVGPLKDGVAAVRDIGQRGVQRRAPSQSRTPGHHPSQALRSGYSGTHGPGQPRDGVVQPAGALGQVDDGFLSACLRGHPGWMSRARQSPAAVYQRSGNPMRRPMVRDADVDEVTGSVYQSRELGRRLVARDRFVPSAKQSGPDPGAVR